MTPKRPVLRYHGGKWKLAPWIVSLMPAHRIYVEPFAGAASVLLRKPRSYAEVYNDRWDTVVNVFRVLRDESKARQLKAALEMTPFARAEFEGQYADDEVVGEVEKARRTILRSYAGFGSASTNGEYATGFRANSNRSGTTPAHDWANYPEHIWFFVDRLRGVCIESKDALELIPQHDTKQTLFYVDPPYVHATRNMRRGNAAYSCEMSDEDHEALAEVLHRLRGMAMLSGYKSKLYGRLYKGWHQVQRAANADGARSRQEIMWFNAAAWRARSQPDLPFTNSRKEVTP